MRACTHAQALAARWAGLVPAHVALLGENMQAVHGVSYDALESPFYLFAVWDGLRRVWASWDEVVAWATLLECPTVPVVHRGAHGLVWHWVERCRCLLEV